MKAMDDSDSFARYAFFIGAGCSSRCGVPVAKELVDRQWLPRLHQMEGPEVAFGDWIKAKFPDYSAETAGRHYGEVFGSVFPFPGDRQLEVERLCNDAKPSYAYYVLSQLLTRPRSRFTTVLTTNFDDLLIDSINLFSDRKPIVISDDLLSSFIRVSYRNPLIVKLHGDLRFRPRNTDKETAMLGTPLSAAVANVLHEMGLIFIGYGGWDQSVASLLEGLGEQDLPYGIYWVSASQPTCLLQAWLEKRGACWIRAESFEELMIHFQVQLGLPAAPQFSRLATVMEFIESEFQEFKTSSAGGGEPASAEQQALSKAIEQVETQPKQLAPQPETYLSLADQADKVALSDVARAEELYAEAFNRFNNVELMERYARFLYARKNDASNAKKVYRQAIQKFPANAPLHNRFAQFLEDALHDLEGAELEYQTAIRKGAGAAGRSDRVGVLLRLGRVEEALPLLRSLLGQVSSQTLLDEKAAVAPETEPFWVPTVVVRLKAFLESEPESGSILRFFRKFQDDHIIRDWFYLFVFGEERDRPEAIMNIVRIFREGRRSRRKGLEDCMEYITRSNLSPRNEVIAAHLARTVTGQSDDFKQLLRDLSNS